MHFTFMVDRFNGYGVGRAISPLIWGLSERGHKVDVLLVHPIIRVPLPENVRVFLPRKGEQPDQFTKERYAHVLSRAVLLDPPSLSFAWGRAVKVLRGIPSPGLFRRACTAASYWDVEMPDCLLPNHNRTVRATLLARRMAGLNVPVVPILHGRLRRHTWRQWRRQWRILLPEAAHVVGVSQGVSDEAAASGGVPSEKVSTIYNPVVTPDLLAKAAETPDHPWLRDDGPPVILGVARLERQKDIPTLVRAFARVATRRPCRLIILGEGTLRKQIEGLVQELKLTDRVSLPGYVENPLPFMARASLFVLSSAWEGLPTVLVEALACGCPCVSTDCPAGPAEILEDGKIGPLVPVGDDAALAKAMESVLDDPPDKDVLQRRAAYFSRDRAVDAYERLFGELGKSVSNRL